VSLSTVEILAVNEFVSDYGKRPTLLIGRYRPKITDIYSVEVVTLLQCRAEGNAL
jgi:hypothetical protein